MAAGALTMLSLLSVSDLAAVSPAASVERCGAASSSSPSRTGQTSIGALPRHRPTATSPPSLPTQLNVLPRCRRWGVFEGTLTGSAAGNPFVDIKFTATFTHAGDLSSAAVASEIKVAGFYDGAGRCDFVLKPMHFIPNMMQLYAKTDAFGLHQQLPVSLLS